MTSWSGVAMRSSSRRMARAPEFGDVHAHRGQRQDNVARERISSNPATRCHSGIGAPACEREQANAIVNRWPRTPASGGCGVAGSSRPARWPDASSNSPGSARGSLPGEAWRQQPSIPAQAFARVVVVLRLRRGRGPRCPRSTRLRHHPASQRRHGCPRAAPASRAGRDAALTPLPPASRRGRAFDRDVLAPSAYGEQHSRRRRSRPRIAASAAACSPGWPWQLERAGCSAASARDHDSMPRIRLGEELAIAGREAPRPRFR